jgi:hypothetical protein
MDMYYYSTYHYNHPEYEDYHIKGLTKEQLEYLKYQEEDLEEFAHIFDMEDK